MLRLEITEGSLITNIGAARQLMDRLRGLGVQLMLDDFGTGYSSLSYLQTFPIDFLKIDRSFIIRVGPDGTNSGLLRAILLMAQTLGLKTVAEGVDSLSTVHLLQELGCEYGQGYLFSRPVPADEAEKICEDKTRWQNIIPNNNPATVAQNREFTHLRLAK